ncbi:UNVERIFIED_CONTAM: hypothetical protein Scaly_2744800 [Sesamum calycinum]|uniref:Reverse transcriptase zinc-binding domain-containing protein n=1 Tax=Sesamum calycinum TaxID=2727403 RepID=A0AAW2J3H9_9LAMI
MLLSLPESYGTFIARQTPYGPSGSMRFTSGGPHFGTGSRRRATLHSSTTCRDPGQNYHRLRFYRCSNPAYGRVDDSKGLVTSKAYEYFRPKLLRQPWKASIWKAFIPPKYSFILWLGLRERLATRDRLAFLHEDPSCSLCINSKESAKHLFFECPSVPTFGRISDSSLASPDIVNPSQCSKVAQEREDWLLCAEQSAASRFGMHGLQPLEAPQ